MKFVVMTQVKLILIVNDDTFQRKTGLYNLLGLKIKVNKGTIKTLGINEIILDLPANGIIAYTLMESLDYY